MWRVHCEESLKVWVEIKMLMRPAHGDALNVITQDLAVALRAALAKTLTALATTGHSLYVYKLTQKEMASERRRGSLKSVTDPDRPRQ